MCNGYTKKYMKISTFILSYAITKGMKSYGPKGVLTQKTNTTKSLIKCQINTIKNISRDISVITGFGRDKLIKTINDSDIKDLYNSHYEKYSEGYAIQKILTETTTSSILILSDGIILGLNKIILKNNYSTVFCTNRSKTSKLNLGCIFENKTQLLEHIFYDISDTVWCEAVLLQEPEITILKDYLSKNNIKNMFLFEIINNSIKLGANYLINKIPGQQIKKIESTKEANKIREIQI